jgi:hypothetical protein
MPKASNHRKGCKCGFCRAPAGGPKKKRRRRSKRR